MKKTVCLFLLITVFTLSSQAQDSAYVRQIIKNLSSKEMHGRGASYHGDSIAAVYLAGEMKRLGVLPLQVDYFQYYTYNCYSLEGDISLKINCVKCIKYVSLCNCHF